MSGAAAASFGCSGIEALAGPTQKCEPHDQLSRVEVCASSVSADPARAPSAAGRGGCQVDMIFFERSEGCTGDVGWGCHGRWLKWRGRRGGCASSD